MRNRSFLCCVLASFLGCHGGGAESELRVRSCTALPRAEFEAVVGGALKDPIDNSVGLEDAGNKVLHCLYRSADAAAQRSVSVLVRFAPAETDAKQELEKFLKEAQEHNLGTGLTANDFQGHPATWNEQLHQLTVFIPAHMILVAAAAGDDAKRREFSERIAEVVLKLL